MVGWHCDRAYHHMLFIKIMYLLIRKLCKSTALWSKFFMETPKIYHGNLLEIISADLLDTLCLLCVVVQRPGSFHGGSIFWHDVPLRSYMASNLPNFRILAYFSIHHIICIGATRPTLQRRVVLEWFYSVTHRNNFVGGTCAPPSALLVSIIRLTNTRKLS